MYPENSSENPDFSRTEGCEMAFTAAVVADELTAKIRDVVKSEPEQSVKGRLRAAARRIGLSAGRTGDYWYGEVRCPPAHEADLIRAYYKAAQELIEARNAYEMQRKEFLERHPVLGRIAPRTVARSALLAEAEAVATSELAPRRR